MAAQAFALAVNFAVAVLELAVLAGDGSADVAQFGVGELEVVVVHQSAVGRPYEVAQAGDGLAELVGDEDEGHEHHGEHHEHEPEEPVVGAHECLEGGVVGHGHAHHKGFVGLGKVEEGARLGVGEAHVAALALQQGGGHLGAGAVVGHAAGGVVSALVEHRARGRDDGEAQVGGEQRAQARQVDVVVVALCSLRGTCHEVGVAAQPRLDHFALVLPLAVILIAKQQQREHRKERREVDEKLVFVGHGREGGDGALQASSLKQ